MANILEKAISILPGNLNSGLGYLIKTVNNWFLTSFLICFFQELPTEVLEEKTALIRHLQTQLRNEEMSLVLLKKIRQSQVLAEQAKEAAAKASISGM